MDSDLRCQKDSVICTYTQQTIQAYLICNNHFCHIYICHPNEFRIHFWQHSIIGHIYRLIVEPVFKDNLWVNLTKCVLKFLRHKIAGKDPCFSNSFRINHMYTMYFNQILPFHYLPLSASTHPKFLLLPKKFLFYSLSVVHFINRDCPQSVGG